MVENPGLCPVTSDGESDSGFASGTDSGNNETQSPDVGGRSFKSFSIKDILGTGTTVEREESDGTTDKLKTRHGSENSIAKEGTETFESTAGDYHSKKRASPTAGVEHLDECLTTTGGVREPDEVQTKKKRRARTTYSTTQLDALEQMFHQEQYPDLVVREEIAQSLDLDEERVQIWFQNRRAKFKRTQKEGRVLWMRNQLFGMGAGLHANHPHPQDVGFASYAQDKLHVLTPPVLPSSRYQSPCFTHPRLNGYSSELQSADGGLLCTVRPSVVSLPPLRIPLPSALHFRAANGLVFSEGIMSASDTYGKR